MKSNDALVRSLDFFTALAGVVLLYVFITNTIPLLEAFGVPELKSKTRYALILRISALAFFLPLAAVYFLSRRRFEALAMTRFFSALTPRSSLGLLILLTAGFFINGAYGGWIRHQALETRAFDLGIFVQAVWSTTQGDFLFSSLKDHICLLGDHFAPLLFLLAPVYALFPAPETLLMIQALATAICIPLVYAVGRQAGIERRDALLFAFLFFLYAPARNTLRSDFHPEVLVEPVMFASFFLLVSGRIKLFLLSLLFLVSAKENLSGVVFIFGLYAFVFQRRRAAGMSIMILSVLYLWVITEAVIPAISGAPYLYKGFYKGLAGHPLQTVTQVLGPGAWEYLLKLLSPVFFLPLLHPPTLILMLPVLIQNLLSENEVTRSFNYHYTVGLTSFVFISAVYGWRVLFEKMPLAIRHRSILVMTLVLVSLLRYGPSEYYHVWKSRKKISALTESIRSDLASIPQEASVLTHGSLIPQTINRKMIYQFEFNPVPTKADTLRTLKPDYVAFYQDFWEPNSLPFEQTLPLEPSLGYEPLISREGRFFIYRKSKSAGE